MNTIDLNADMGEGFGPWTLGDDAAVLDLVTSANIACGFHAGDPDVMAATVRGALARGVAVGAHPGFADLQGFGRRRMSLSDDSLGNLVRYQLGAIMAVAKSEGGRVSHLKLHGAMANMASEDEAMARTCFAAALSVDPDLIVFVLAGTAQERAARALGAHVACEIFADRAYNDDATLVDRGLPGAVISDPAVAAARIVAMVRARGIIAASGAHLPSRIDTICLHGDTVGAREIGRHVRAALESEGIRLCPPARA